MNKTLGTAVAVTLIGGLAGCGSDDGPELNKLPAGFTQHSVTDFTATTPGTGSTAATQDLLTGGLGKAGLMVAAPAYADPAAPTAAELRRNALHSNYRGLVDFTANGGYGRFYGPNIDANGNDTLGAGMVPGREYVASLDDGSGNKRTVVAVQVPASFNPEAPCLVLAPSSGSRGVYGAIGTAGEWGLKRGCAVALTDAGKGMGLYDPTDDSVHQVDGTRASRSVAGALSHFAAALSDTARAAFNSAFPNRLALKHAHSQQNPEKDWGNDTLAAGRYAMYVLNEQFGRAAWDGSGKEVRFTRDNTLVIAASVSNGGAAVLRAAEQDADGLIDGVVAGEPSAQPSSTTGYGVSVGGVAVPTFGRPLFDYFTHANLYQPCASLAPAAVLAEASTYNTMGSPAFRALAANRCNALAARGLLTGATTAEQAADALARLRAYGFTAEHDTMHNAHYGLGNAAIITMMYANAYGRFSVADNVCGLSVAATSPTTGEVVPVAANTKAASYAAGNGTANGSPASVVYNNSVGGARQWSFGVSPTSGTADLSLDSALCLRSLALGTDVVTGAALTASSTPTLAQSQAVRAGVNEVLLNGNLRGKPTLMVGGRSDALIPVNHSERAYLAFNRLTEGAGSPLRYIEVTNAQHFDGFLPFPGFDNRFVPLHVYFIAAMDAMWAKLKNGTELPPSQVVRATPRGGLPGAAPALAAANLPAIATTPAAADAIGFAGSTVNIPQ
ncbi:D-(-)-3-hydroxybutyrate oligomer hydrolase [Aquincola sp. J276]|uniref:D-(-)-3-hydroxybutyrate oligomer hydrolase n=1 Tax=Aquincola sp. J276 TaxID=2898432 RepID=UPI00215177A3|nr:D-(-)-3-hydroxybutyrate oligomer hydrolase [Aquincola sp. J276]MCR5866522.1 D-(-)-3-hydroxybutyrate oligomer hydrolase [Aquincola sp. J276]